MKKEILDVIKRGGVSFVELAREVPGFKGDMQIRNDMNWYNEEERRLEEFGSEFFKDNPDAEEFVASDAYKRAEARQKRWNEQSSKLDEKMKNLLERGCINTSGFDHS